MKFVLPSSILQDVLTDNNEAEIISACHKLSRRLKEDLMSFYLGEIPQYAYDFFIPDIPGRSRFVSCFRPEILSRIKSVVDNFHPDTRIETRIGIEK